MAKRKRNICPHNVAWLRLQNGTLRVDLETSEVFSLIHGRWVKVVFFQTVKQMWQGRQCSGGYWYTKLRIVIDGVRYRQNVFLHRIVWMAKNNEELLPGDQVDHGPAGKECNHWSNLEKVSAKENSRRRDLASASLAATYGEF